MKSMRANAEKDKNMVDNIMYNSSSSLADMEEENKLLKQTVHNLRLELDRLQANPLLVCEIKDIVADNAIIRLQNGNLFYVNISKDVGKLIPGDQVLVEQKNLNVIRKAFAIHLCKMPPQV